MLQPETVHASTSTSAGFWLTVWVLRLVSLLTVNVYWVPSESPFFSVSTNSIGATSWLANPWPLTVIGVPPVSGPP